MEPEKSPWSNVQTGLLFSLTLGLAPFFPEPHILGKLRWLFGGGQGMQLMDWLDLLMHGAPWMYLIGTLFVAIRLTLSKKEQAT